MKHSHNSNLASGKNAHIGFSDFSTLNPALEAQHTKQQVGFVRQQGKQSEYTLRPLKTLLCSKL